MKNTAFNMLLMIEPTAVSSEPVIDTLTRRVTASLRKAVKKNATRGWHTSTAVKNMPEGRNAPDSDSSEHHITVPGGGLLITNSLAIHYIAYCRAEIPDSEIDKIMLLLSKEEAEPTGLELWPKSCKDRSNAPRIYRGR